jgi:WD40 repeat protein
MQILSIPKKKRIYALAFSPSGRDLAAACGDGYVRVWDLRTGDVRQWISIEHTSDGHDIVYLDDERLVVAGPGIRWWDIPANGWNEISPLNLWRRRLCLSPDGQRLAVVDEADSIDWPQNGMFLFDTSTWTHQPRLENVELTTGGVAFSPDGAYLATGHLVRVGFKQRSFAHINAAYAVNDYDYIVHLRELPSGRTVQTSTGWQNGVSKLKFSPDSKVLAGAAGPRLRIWDIDGNCELAIHKRGTKHFQDLCFNSDGRFLATVSNDETVRIWETRTWQERTTFTWQIGKLLNIALAPDGQRAAAGSDRGQIVIWDIEE